MAQFSMAAFGQVSMINQHAYDILNNLYMNTHLSGDVGFVDESICNHLSKNLSKHTTTLMQVFLLQRSLPPVSCEPIRDQAQVSSPGLE